MNRFFGNLLGPPVTFVADVPFDEAYTIMETRLQNRLIREDFQLYNRRKVRVFYTGDEEAFFEIKLESQNRALLPQYIGIDGLLIAYGETQTLIKAHRLITPMVMIAMIFLFTIGIASVAVMFVNQRFDNFWLLWGILTPVLAVFAIGYYVDATRTLINIMKTELHAVSRKRKSVPRKKKK